MPSLYIPSFLEAGAWLPFAGLALVRVVSAGGLWWTAVLGMAAGMPVVAGGYQTSLYAAYGLALGRKILLDTDVFSSPQPTERTSPPPSARRSPR